MNKYLEKVAKVKTTKKEMKPKNSLHSASRHRRVPNVVKPKRSKTQQFMNLKTKIKSPAGPVKRNKYLEKAAAIHINPHNKGLLHKKLHIAEGSSISSNVLEAKKEQAEKSKNTKLEREVVFAQNAKKWHHKG